MTGTPVYKYGYMPTFVCTRYHICTGCWVSHVMYEILGFTRWGLSGHGRGWTHRFPAGGSCTLPFLMGWNPCRTVRECLLKLEDYGRGDDKPNKTQSLPASEQNPWNQSQWFLFGVLDVCVSNCHTHTHTHTYAHAHCHTLCQRERVWQCDSVSLISLSLSQKKEVKLESIKEAGLFGEARGS
jgi:hypothetical protein